MKKGLFCSITCIGVVFSLFLSFINLHAQAFTVNIQISQNISCNGSSDGSLSATVNPPGSANTFLWSNGATTPAISNLSGGVYSVQVQNAAGGTATATAVLSEPAPFGLISLTELPTQAIPMVLVDIETNGGTSPYNYVWTDESNNIFSLDEDLFNAPAGVYTLNAADQHGCTAELTPVTLTQVLAINDALSLGFSAFPNPVSQLLSLENPDGYTAFLQIFNAAGQLVFTQEFNGKQHVINVSAWPEGNYIAVLSTKKSTAATKVIVQH